MAGPTLGSGLSPSARQLRIPGNVWRSRAIWLPLIFCATLAGCFPLARPMPATGIVIVVSNDTSAFIDVQREIVKRYKQPVETYRLRRDENANAALQKKIQSSKRPVVVAIGLPAARLARHLSRKKVVFCQVFNYQDEDLITPWMKGVSATASARELFSTWKRLSPGLRSVGMITGKNQQGLMEEVRAAARENRLQLIHVETRSDKGTLYAYKRLAGKIQGLWLVPDNRVLSREVIINMMSYSVKEGKQVAVFVPDLLGLGGILSVETIPADIAMQVLARVKLAEENSGVPGPSIVPLTKADIKINSVMTTRLNLKIPMALRGMADAN
ncbi:MAG: ABC transporter substrate-binding protein [Sulfuricaulis sp.]